MKNGWIPAIVMAALFAGCATEKEVRPPAGHPSKEARKERPVRKKREPVQLDTRTAEKTLAKAVDLMEHGDTTGAARALGTIVAAKGVPGVTDEALFRLALLTLKPSTEAPVTKRGRHLLRRLKEEYPSSSWTAQAAPLQELINVEDELRQQNRSLKATNQSLAKKVSELTESIDQLKDLDLELEQKNR